MKYISFLILLSCIFLSCNTGTYKNNYIQFGPVKLSSEEYLVLKKSLDGLIPDMMKVPGCSQKKLKAITITLMHKRCISRD